VMPRFRQLDMKMVNQLISEPDQSPVLLDSAVSFDYDRAKHAHQMLSVTFSPARTCDENAVYPYLLRMVCLLNYELPFADPIRRRLPELLAAIRKFLDHDANTLPFGMPSTQSGWSAEAIDQAPILAKFSSLVGKCVEGKDGLFRIDNGLIVGAVFPPAVTLRFRTAKLRTQQDLNALLAVASMTYNYESDGSRALQHAYFTLVARGKDADALIACNRSNAITAGAWDQDPRVSAPQLVKEVEKQLQVSTAAATLYLQVLALHDPTNAKINQWNGWTSKQLGAASAELIAGEHLVEAKRSRAGRTHFLPGGWEPLKAPNLPLETWKLTMFGYANTDALRGGDANLIVCPRPAADQFHLAWQRVKSGDAPKYEAV
jgi:hypothetical protein